MVNRLKQLRGELKLTQQELAGTLGITKSAVSMIENRKAALSERNRSILSKEYGVRAEWLDTGRGPMLDPLTREAKVFSAALSAPHSQSVPLYDIRAAGGLEQLFADRHRFQPADWIHIPGLPRADGAVRVAGEGMSPLLNNGDIVIYRQINEIEGDIFWGAMYLLSLDVAGERYAMVRYVRRSEKLGFVLLAGHDPHHTDKEVELNRVHALALVMASIRINSAI
jgi:transcriptional regulator with XRE-family HTH domain